MFSFICLRRAAFFAAKESGKRNRQRGPIPRRSPLETLPTAKAGPAGPSIGSSPGLRRFYERREKLSLNTQAFGRWALHIATFSLRKAPVPRSLEGGSNGGNRRAVSPLAGRRGSWGNLSEGSPMRFDCIKGNPRLCRGTRRASSEGRSRQEKSSRLK